MKLAVSGTYSAGKTMTVMALAHHTGVPRTLAKTIREILPLAVPGKSLAQCTPAEYLQLAVRRHVGRAVEEALHPDGFISDGSSLQEWIYGAARGMYGMDPSSTSHLERVPEAAKTQEMRFFEDVVAQFGHAFRQHVKASFDAYVHLRNELPLSADGHRPMNDRFRATCDEMLLGTLDELEIPYHVVGGTLGERLRQIVEIFDFPTVMDVEEAIARAGEEYARIDKRLETARASAA
ncbi:AAA family ATPase [Streptomyces sp. NBC_00893]|uniref:AAA family ATPase n=1 Tax=Streptomyces sp. NBC_00893 TaxID=2975862 RepID=UPI002253AE37|nr:AAA family ATPase [Streptomyces sp. NBC_00893]MCX4844622.1 ATP-binding protein [Streptomyces sp. NBC_00893]